MNLKSPNPLTKAIGVIALALLLNACSSDNNQAATNTGNSTKTVAQVPWEALTVPVLSNLRAYVIIDGNTGSRIAMTINTTNNTATASIPGLSLASHTVQIVYEYIDGTTTYIVAQSSVEPVDLTGGSTTFNIPSTAYVTASFDTDTDGLSNAYELAAGTNPGDSSCVVGFSLVGSCTL